MKNKYIVQASTKASTGGIHFITSKDFENIDFFQNITRIDSDYDFSNLEVYINDKLTNQSAESISANANDDIVIKATDDHYPWFGRYTEHSGLYDIDYIKSIEEPLPLMYQANGETITSFNLYFCYCTSLTSIPVGLFDNNPQVTDFSECFYTCTSLTSIPAGLFDKNTLVTDFNNCFYACTSLTSIPAGLFDNCPNVTDFSECFNRCSSLTNIPAGLFDNCPLVTRFSQCFYRCSNLTNMPIGLFDNNPNVIYFDECFYRCPSLTVNVQIGSTASSVNVDRFAYSTKEKGTVYCRAGSAAYKAFSNNSTANVSVLTY